MDRASDSYLDLDHAPYAWYGVKYIGLVSLSLKKHEARGSHLDLGRAPYALYGVKYIGLVSLSLKKHEARGSHLDLDHAPYALYGVKYIDPVSLAHPCIRCRPNLTDYNCSTCTEGYEATSTTNTTCIKPAFRPVPTLPCRVVSYNLYGVKYIGLVSLA